MADFTIEELTKQLESEKQFTDYLIRERDHYKESLTEANTHLNKFIAEDLKNKLTKTKTSEQKTYEDIKFEDVGGLDQVLDKIKNFQLGILHSEVYKAYACNPPNGLLMHGPPGTGKSMIAKAMSNEISARFKEVSVTDYVSKWVGEAEQKLEGLLRESIGHYTSKNEKTVMFFDEGEGVFGRRNQNNRSDVFDRVARVILRYMDGMGEQKGIIWVTATNHLNLIDPAIKRSGRFDYVLEIPKPDNVGVYDILEKQMDYRERKAGHKIFDIYSLDRLAEKLYDIKPTGADIANVLRVSSEERIKYLLEEGKDRDLHYSETFVSQEDIERVLLDYEKKSDKKLIGFGRGDI